MDGERGRGRGRWRWRWRWRWRSRRWVTPCPDIQANTSRSDKCPSPSPSPSTRLKKPVRVRNQTPAAANWTPAEKEETVKRDWVDLETHDDLLFRHNLFNLGLITNQAENNNVEGGSEITGPGPGPNLDPHTSEELRCRVKNCRPRPSVGAVNFKETNPSSHPLSKISEREQQLKRFVRDNLKQLLCDLKNKPKPTLDTVVKNRIQRTLEYFKNEMKGGDYEYVSCDKLIPTSLFVTHANFRARLKGSDSPPELFFAVLENGCPHEATHCCKLDHDRGGTFQPGEVVCHCEHVKCLDCDRWSGYVIRPGEDVIM